MITVQVSKSSTLSPDPWCSREGLHVPLNTHYAITSGQYSWYQSVPDTHLHNQLSCEREILQIVGKVDNSITFVMYFGNWNKTKEKEENW